MASRTTHFNLIKPAENEKYNVEDFNGNSEIIDEELAKRGVTVNGKGPDENGNYVVDEVNFAHEIVTDDAQQSSGEFLFRTTGGSASLSDGPAMLVSIQGRSTHTGKTEESLQMTVNAVARTDPDEPITASIDRDTFVEYVSTSGTITLTYTNAWSANPSLYGVTVEGTPVSGDEIVIVYVKEERGLITNSMPETFASTGWNLYDHANGYARVKKYSDSYGFLIGGTYSSIKFAATLDGAQSTIVPVSGYFTIPSDGYVFVTGGDGTTTYILMTWSDWSEGYEGEWEAYTESEIDFSALIGEAGSGEDPRPFPYGLMSIGAVADELNFNMGKAISRIMRMAYTAQNLADAKASGRAWDADENYIYIVRPSEVVYDMAIDGTYDASDHGQEFISGSTIPVFVQTLYGQNLVDKLRTDVVTKSQDIVNALDSTATDKALSAAMGKALNDRLLKIQTGSRWVTYGSGNHTDITFTIAFSSIPLVVAYIENASGDGFAGCASTDGINITNITTTGFRVWHERIDSGSNAANVVWKAIGII